MDHDELRAQRLQYVKDVRDRQSERAAQLLHALAEVMDCANFDRVDPNAVKRWRGVLRGDQS